jgi:hypothetical protein
MPDEFERVEKGEYAFVLCQSAERENDGFVRTEVPVLPSCLSGYAVVRGVESNPVWQHNMVLVFRRCVEYPANNRFRATPKLGALIKDHIESIDGSSYNSALRCISVDPNVATVSPTGCWNAEVLGDVHRQSTRASEVKSKNGVESLLPVKFAHVPSQSHPSTVVGPKRGCEARNGHRARPMDGYSVMNRNAWNSSILMPAAHPSDPRWHERPWAEHIDFVTEVVQSSDDL